MENEINYGLGCTPSKIDGTEHIYQDISLELPKSFSYVGTMPPVLNQGRTNKCVCYSLTTYLDWRKNCYEGDNDGSQFDIDTLYDVRSNKPQDNGMQIKEALRYLRHQGLNGIRINEYCLIKSINSLKEALILNGPCVAGLPFCSKNIEFWKHGERIYGGHCILFVGYNEDGFIIRNSWGTNYADQGYITFPYEDFQNKVFECWTIL